MYYFLTILASILAVLVGWLAGTYTVPVLMVAAAGLVLIAGTTSRPRFLIILALLVLVLGQIGRLPPLSGEVVVLDLIVGLLAVNWFPLALARREKLVPSFTYLLWLGFLLLALLSLVVTPLVLSKRELAFNGFYLIRLLAYSTLLWIIPGWYRTEQDRARLLRLLAAVGMAVVGLGFVQLVLMPDIGPLARFGWDPHVGRLVSTFLDPNYLGGFLAIILALLAAYIAEKQHTYRTWFLVVAVLIASVLTFSRSGYLAIAVVVLVFGLRYSWKVLLVTLLCLLPAALAIPRVRDRVAGGFSLDVTSRMRVLSWQNALEVGEAFPVLGVGYNNYREAQQALGILQGGAQSHAASGSDSSLLNVEATTGWLGLALFLAAAASLYRQTRRVLSGRSSSTQRVASYALQILYPAMFVHAFFVNSLFYPFILLPLLVVAGLVLSYREEA